MAADIVTWGEAQALRARGITEETCAKWRYLVADISGKPAQIANYIRDGVVVAQKIRFAGKQFTVTGTLREAGLYGQHLWRDGGMRVVITEGEIDALTVSQLQGNKWPVVSVPSGITGATKAIGREIEWLSKFESIVLLFDNDPPDSGAAAECRKAIEEVSIMFPPGKVKVARLPLKDANEMLTAGRGSEVIDAIWSAKTQRPDGIVSGDDITLSLLKAEPVLGYATPYPGLDAMARGMRKGELVLFTAGTGVGKSTIVREIAYHLNVVHGLSIGNIFLEESYKKTAQGYVALDRSLPLGTIRSSPDALTDEQYEESLKRCVSNGRTYFYNHFGSLESDHLLGKMHYLACIGVDFIILDHISIVISGQEGSGEGERKDIDRLVTQLRQLVEQTGVGVVAIAHLAKAPSGSSHEEGGRVTLNDLRGSAALKQLPDTIIALERDQQGETPQESDIRVLKNREWGDLGVAARVIYSRETGRLEQMDMTNPFTESAPAGASAQPSDQPF